MIKLGLNNVTDIFITVVFAFQILLAIGNLGVSILVFKKVKINAVKSLGHFCWVLSSINMLIISALSNIF